MYLNNEEGCTLTGNPQILIIVGTGASKFSSNRNIAPGVTEWQPPLAIELLDFAGPRGAICDLTNIYPGALSIATQLHSKIRSTRNPSWNIEEDLSELATHKSEALRRAFKHVPPFLRDYLQEVCDRYKGLAGNYLTRARYLVGEAENGVTFVSLNYDMLLERA
jgi:hypothetical protein